MLRLLSVTRSSLLRYSMGLLAIAVALLFLWPGLIENLLSTGYGEWMFMSHGHCYLWVPSLVALHVGTDLLIGISYTAISITLAYLVHRARRDIPFHWIFLAFGLFIVACGATHFMEVLTLWNATYWLSGYVKLVTATASLATAFVLPAVVPKTLILVRDAKTSGERKQELERANQRLEEELSRRMRAEESLQQTNRVLEAIFQSSPLAIYAFDLDGQVLMWNAASERIFGWSEQEAIGRPLPIVSQGEQEGFRQLRQRVLGGDAFTNVETYRRKKDGSPIDVSISTAPLRDANGDIEGIVALTADITERKRAEEELRQSEERFRLMVEAVKDYAIFMLDTEGRIVTWNAGAEHIKGYRAEEVIGKYFSLFYPTEAVERGLPEHELKVAASEGRFEDEGWRLRKDGTRHWANIVITAIRDGGGRLIGFAKVTRDLTERKRMEAELRASEAELRALFAAMTDVIFVLDEEGRYLKIAPTNPALLYKPADEIIGKTMHEVFPRDQADFFLNWVRQALATRQPVNIEYSLPISDAETWFAGTVSPMSESSVIFVARDMTERKRAEEALRESEERYRELVENAYDIIYSYDLMGRFTSVNKAGERVIGYTREEILRMSITDIIAPDYLKLSRARIAAMIAGETLSVFELEAITKDGSRIALEINSRLLLHDGVAMGIEGIARDITDRKRAEEALRESEERFRLIIEGVRDYAIFMLDTEGRIASWNEGAERLKGYQPDEIIGQHHSHCYTAEDIAEGKPEQALKVAATDGRYEDELWMLRKDGSLFLANLIITALRDGEGRLRGFVDVTRDITERKRAEVALRASEELFRELLELLPVGVYSCDRDGVVKHFNRRAVELWGRAPALNDTHERFCGSFKMYWPDGTFITRDQTPMAEVLRTGVEIRGVEAVFERPDHSRITIELHIIPLKDAEGNVTGAINCFQDISERKQRMKALKESERQLATAQQMAHLGNFEYDFTSQTESWSDELYRIMGLRPQEVIPGWERFLEYVHPDDRSYVHRVMEKALQDYQPFTYECRLLRPNGTVRTMMTRGEVATDGTGNPVKLQGVGQDITELKQAEIERDIERQLLKALIDQLPVGVLVCDMEGRYIKTNQRVCEILGIGCDALNGMTVEEVRQLIRATNTAGTPLTDAETPTLVALRTQQQVNSVETIITTPGGEVRRINANATPVIVDGEVPFGSVTVITDVTEQYTLQEQLRQSQKMESIGTLAGGVAHDFNNLLTVILGNTQLAFRDVQPGTPLQERLLEVEKAGTRASTLTRQLLAFSRRQRLERKTINLNETINDFMKMMRRVIGEDIEVSVQESVRLHPIFADPAQIEQVVMNLAVNARDAMPGGGGLTIETRNVELDEAYQREHPYAKPGRYVQMTVSDTGAGMDTETKERIFEPFFTTKGIGKGTGLGLSMVYGIIKQHGGLIEVESELGRGTRFHIYLPVDEKTVKEEAQEETLPALRGGTETILVAEDEEALRTLTRTILEELGYTVLLAKDGAEAVEVYEANREQIALLLFDIVMPRMGGREAYERISSPNGPVPVIFMTGYSAEIVQYEFVKQNKFIEEAGATLMQKPYTVETLGRIVREMLDGVWKRYQYSQS